LASMTQKAAILGISTSYLSLIWNGKRIPSYKLAQQWKPITGKRYEWWQAAKVSQIQKVLDAVEG